MKTKLASNSLYLAELYIKQLVCASSFTECRWAGCPNRLNNDELAI